MLDHEEDGSEVKKQTSEWQNERRKERLIELALDQLVWRQRQSRKLERKNTQLRQLLAEKARESEAEEVAPTRTASKITASIRASRFTSRAHRLARLSVLAKVGVKSLTSKSLDEGEPAAEPDTELVESRARVLAEGARIAAALNERDGEEAIQAFSRYDEDGSGTLELPEIRAVLEDLGLLPDTAGEKAAVRRTLVNFARGTPDGDTEPDEQDGGGAERSQLPSVFAERRSQESLARSIEITAKELPSFIGRVRARLRATRARKYIETFRRYDVFESGELEFPRILKILQELRLLSEDDEKQQAFFCQWVLRIVKEPGVPTASRPASGSRASASSRSSGDSEDSERPTAAAWVFGTMALRVLLLGQEHASAGPSLESWDALQGRALSELDGRAFDVNEFEVFIDFLQIACNHGALEEQRRAAQDLGVSNMRLFLEFRQDLISLRKVFQRCDKALTGYITENEVWIAFNNLGLVPRGYREKDAFLKAIHQEHLSFVPNDGGEVFMAKGHIDNTYKGDQPLSEGINKLLGRSGQLASGGSSGGKVSFQRFLNILSQVRAWLTQSMKEDLRSLFDRCLRRRQSGVGVDNTTLGIREVAMALEDLQMSPRSVEDQQQIRRFLDDANEWGFEPLTVDFETFVRFVRRVREWRARTVRGQERSAALQMFEMRESNVDEYRVAFDILDAEGSGEISIAGVRSIFKMLGRSITSERLRELFGKVDRREAGMIRFLEFLQLVSFYEGQRRSFIESEVLHAFDNTLRGKPSNRRGRVDRAAALAVASEFMAVAGVSPKGAMTDGPLL